MRKYAGLLALLWIVVTLTLRIQAQDNPPAQDVIARLNEWRISEGRWPLKPNTTLEALALKQAQYVVSLPELPDDLHLDGQGLLPRQRALLAPFNWPYYELPGQIAIGENAALGDVDYALEFWQGSDLHSRTALNPAYREVGVAALPYRDTTFFIVVFGARPDVLPALVDPRDGQTLYLSNERFEQARFHDSIQDVTEIQIFDSAGRPLYDAPIAWTERLAVPVDAGEEVFILSSDGEHDVLSPVDLDHDQVLLPGEAEPEAPAVVIEATPLPGAQPTAVPPVEATATPEPEVIIQPDLLILYSGDTLDVLNVSGAAADWRALELVGTITFPFTQWTKVTQFPLDALPARHCLQIRSQGVSGDVVKPEDCTWVRSLITVGVDRVFWAQGPFTVQRNGAVLAQCEPGAGVCAVDLP